MCEYICGNCIHFYDCCWDGWDILEGTRACRGFETEEDTEDDKSN